ncbi:MAG: hypothetical protein K2L12_05380 [Clostridia bacterium]|nr:hypothetical protein [Clostridia bacterium]
MAEEIVTTETPEKEPFGKRLGANLKERWRKFLVNTKRKPQRLAFFVLLVSTIIWMFGIVYFGQATIYDNVAGMGLCIFVNTMFSILTLLLFMNTFPKRAKHMNYIMLGLTFAFMAVMITCDIVWYLNCYPVHMNAYNTATSQSVLDAVEPGLKAFPLVITHLIFVCISVVMLATLPLYSKLIMKINTSKVIEENKLSEEIDTSAEV